MEIGGCQRIDLQEIDRFMSGNGEKSGLQEGSWLIIVSLLVETTAVRGKSHLGKGLEELIETKDSKRRERSECRTPRGEIDDNRDATGIGANRGEGL